MRLLHRWIRSRAGERREGLDLRELTEEVEAGLRDIGFDEVTVEDRAIFVEHAVIWQVRRALRAGQFDLALALQRFGVERIAELQATRRSGGAGAWRIYPFHPPQSERPSRQDPSTG